MRLFLLAATLAVAGCLGGDFANDAGATVSIDFSIPSFDLGGVDLYSAYNCAQLNAKENQCTTAVCVFNERKMATPRAVFEEIELQDCFGQYCPKTAVCTPSDMGTYSAACATCINNTYVASGTSCSGTAPECHKCLVQATTCFNDT